MTVNYTTNLALGQPVTGTESGTWGDDVNNSVTSYLDIAIAGGLAITITTTDVTLSLTQGTSSATNIGSTTAQYAILNVSGAMTAARNLILPSSSRQYVINNNTTGGFALTVKGAATTGVTMVNGESSHIYWNGSDYAKLSNAPGGTGTFTNLTYTGTLTGSTGVIAIGTNQIYKDSSGNVGIGTSSPGVKLDVSGVIRSTGTSAILAFSKRSTGTGDAWGMYSQSGEYNIYDYTAGVSRLVIDTSGNVGIGTSSPNLSSSSTALTVNTGTAANYSAFELASGGTLNYHINANNSAVYHVAAGTRPWVVYTGGSERMRIDSTGNVGIGSSTVSGLSLRVSKSLTPGTDSGATDAYGVRVDGSIAATATNSVRLYSTYPSTVASAFTLGTLSHYQANQGTLGAGSAITSQYGFQADSGLVGATTNIGFLANDIGGASATSGKTNIGFYSSLSTASGGGSAWNIYANGTAPSYFAGSMGIGTNSPGAKLDVAGNIRLSAGSPVVQFNNGGPQIYVTTANTLQFSINSGSSEAMRIDSSGNVGIGASSPASAASKTFTVQNGGSGGSTSITTGDYSANAVFMIPLVESFGARSDGNTTFGGRLGAAFRRTDGTAIASGANLGYYGFGAQWGTDTSYQSAKLLYAASIIGVAEGSFTSATAMPTAITFCTGSTGGQFQTANTAYGTERMRIDSSGNVQIGSALATAAAGGRVFDIYNLENTNSGSYALARLITYNVAGTTTVSADIFKNKAGSFVFNNNETNAAANTSFGIGGTERMRIDSSGNVLVTNPAGLGYGTGSGGTVTQATSKSTAVTLNKPTGQITMNAAALAAGATVGFSFNNSVMSVNDVLVLSINANSPNGASYSVKGIASSSASVFLTNTSAGSLSDAVIINFAIIKGATS